MSKDIATKSSIERRTFLKGLGLAATATTLGGGALLSERSAQAAQSVTPLANSPLVMIWRRIVDLGTMKKTVSRVNGWSLVGEDSYSAMFDAGNALVSYWSQYDLLTGHSPKGTEPDAVLGLATTDTTVETCTIDTQRATVTAYNPSNQMTMAVSDPDLTAKRIRGGGLRPAGQASASFVDDTGNCTRYQPLAGLDHGKIGLRLQTLRDAGMFQGGEFHPLVSYELLVSSLAAARAFYQLTLGLRIESETENELIFDTGNVSLRVRQEESVGLLRSIRRKLGDDLIVFHTSDLDEAVHSLGQAGVVFPNGIEESTIGRLANFKDPDGHALSIWQMPARSTHLPIDFFPVLDRLLVNAAAYAA